MFKNILIAVFAVASLVSAASVPCIDERCLACGRRLDPHKMGKPLRKMSFIQWALDDSEDLHWGKCLDNYRYFVRKR